MRCPFLQSTWFGDKIPIPRNADLYKFWPCSIKLLHFQSVLVWERTIKFSDCPPVLSYSTNLRCCHICSRFISCFRAISGHFSHSPLPLIDFSIFCHGLTCLFHPPHIRDVIGNIIKIKLN